MPEISINGQRVSVANGTTVAAAVLNSGVNAFRRSVNGEPRAPLCSMGTCFECRLTIDGTPQSISCQTLVRDGMQVTTGA
jgi:predicted molibdopterin-dependent oxidoreductase YjgC